MRYIDVCSGISAPTAAWKPLGWQALCFAEIEAAPRSVLAHHYPDVPLRGDFTEIRGDEYGPVDLLVGGTPCQSFSVAGLRGGLADERGNLALEYLRLADRARPRWLVWENVPGVLSSGGGRDFGTFLGGLAQLGYGFAYAVLDAQHFGVPQRRRRVFVVGYLGDWRRAAAVLFERHSLQGHPAPRREARKVVAALTADGVGTCGADDNQGQAGHLIPDIVGQAMSAKWAKGSAGPAGPAGPAGAEHHNLIACQVAHSLRGEGFDASEAGTGRGTPLVCVHADALNRTGEAATPSPDAEGRVRLRDAGMGVLDDGTSYNLTTGQPHAICFTAKDHGGDAGEIAPTLRSGSHSGSHANAGVMPTVAFGGQMSTVQTDIELSQTLQAKNPQAMANASSVRRLTPRECERLQGFPEAQKTYTILLCRDLSDQQKANALAALQCRKLQSNAWSADANGWALSAEAAADHSSTSHLLHGSPVAVDVLIDLERQEVRLHSAGRSFSPATSAGARSAFPLPMGIESFAQLAVLLTRSWDLVTATGRAESLASITPSTPHWNGSSIALSCGREIEGDAADAGESIALASRLITSTTLPSGLDTRACVSTLKTLSSCVAHAIAGFIPEQTKAASSFSVRLTTTQGFTLVPHRGKPMADGPRYKMLGNSMAVPVVRWIGERIAAADAMAIESLAA